MSKRATVWFLVLSLVALSGAHADERTITWLMLEFPPFFIAGGPERGNGIGDGVMQILEQEMKGWRHATEPADPATILSRMKAGENVCSAAYIKTAARERAMTFSIPNLILPPNGITIRTEDLHRFGGGGPVSLADLLADTSLKAAVARGRAYGDGVDDLLEQHKGSPNIYSRLDTDVYSKLFALLIRGSVDYVVGYPYEAHFLATQMDLGGKVTSLSLQENPEYTLAHVVCSRSEWGQRTIAEINDILRVEREKPEYRGLVERWLGGELVDDFRAHYSGFAADAETP